VIAVVLSSVVAASTYNREGLWRPAVVYSNGVSLGILTESGGSWGLLAALQAHRQVQAAKHEQAAPPWCGY
jgi:hypothetical protein